MLSDRERMVLGLMMMDRHLSNKMEEMVEDAVRQKMDELRWETQNQRNGLKKDIKHIRITRIYD
jgi:hypothetical protein